MAGPQPEPFEPDIPTEPPSEVRLTTIRKRIAQHMVASKSTSPHVAMAVEVEFTAVDEARAAFGSQWKEREGFSLTYLPFIARAVCTAIADYPNVNAKLTDDALPVYPYVNLGIAVDLDIPLLPGL